MAGYVGTKAVLLSTTAATVGGDADIGGDLTVDTSTLHVDSANNRVGVGTISPSTKLDVEYGSGNSYPAATVVGPIFSDKTASENFGLNIFSDNASNASINFGDEQLANAGRIVYDHNGNANTMAFYTSAAERMRIDSSGNVGINGTPSASDGVFKLIQIGGANKYATFGAQANGGFAALMGSNFYYNGGWKRTDAGRVTKIETGPDSSSEELFSFQYAGDGAADSAISWSEAMRIDSSGNLLVGTTDSTLVGRPDTARLCVDNENGEDCIQIRGSGSDHLNIASWVPVTGNAYHIGFGSGTSSYTEHGVISTNGSTTTYSTTSDHRLKENVVDLEGATERLKQLRPKRFNFIVNPNTILDGFLAHEAQVVVPEAVTGTKDAMRDERYEVTPAVTDDEGNVTTEAVMGTRSVPAYQGIDQSKLVPLLTAALQEALDEITDLKARVATLEAN